MAAFQFPDPTIQQTVVNPITGSTYQWKEPPGKWVVTVSVRKVEDIIWEGDNPPIPRGDYKLWYSTDTLELYFWYEDENGVGAWVPTSAPITMLEDLDNTVFEIRRDLNQTNVAVAENENRIGRTIEYSDTAPTIYPEIEVTKDIIDIDGITVIGTETEYFFNELNYKFWYDTSRLELLVLYKDLDDGAYSYVPVALPLTNIDLDALNSQVQANSYSNNQQSQAIVALEELIVRNFEDHEEIRNEIVELEEEIDAIAPSNERGEWNFNPVGVASPGYYAFLDSNTQPTDRFDGAATIYVSTRDADNTNHNFNNHEAGEYLQIFNKEGNGYGLYQITDIDDNSGGNNPFYAFTVDFVQSLVTAPKAENRGRFKFFTIAEGDPGAYVLKTGDEMSGDLKVDSDILATGKYLGGHYNGSTFNTFSASVEIIENSGMLKYGSRRCMFWNDNGGVLTYGNRSIFGWSENNSTAFKPIKIYDTSLVVDDNHAIHKGYVDEQIAEVKENIDSTPTGRVIITPLEFRMDNYSGYPNDDQIAGLTSGGNPTTSRDVYGYHIPWKWFEQNHPELIGFIFTENGNLIDGREANLYVRTLNGRPGLEIKDSSRQTRYATVTIQGWHVQVDDISEDQYTHKF